MSEQGQCVREWRNTTPICLFTWWRPWTIGWELLRNLCRYIMSNVPCHDAVLFVVLIYISIYICVYPSFVQTFNPMPIFCLHYSL